eukprot:snap_masked-scaffold_12-processed-gene-12.30-mRNA-1 protein AED:1.00 eAED:1.00 QI:0/0/0/0/1/1/3/0/107
MKAVYRAETCLFILKHVKQLSKFKERTLFQDFKLGSSKYELKKSILGFLSNKDPRQDLIQTADLLVSLGFSAWSATVQEKSKITNKKINKKFNLSEWGSDINRTRQV